ncbi:unnamed protein product [Nesidiocoris tenuis]|uniref:Uncharacterized protein n=1 Tax=Nesidiocoris tenuis TaxID=355587 RepID=A0A6H5GA08_9HEMI|nr:unnamed protein product [Nesidiocoris tenuis]
MFHESGMPSRSRKNQWCIGPNNIENVFRVVGNRIRTGGRRNFRYERLKGVNRSIGIALKSRIGTEFQKKISLIRIYSKPLPEQVCRHTLFAIRTRMATGEYSKVEPEDEGSLTVVEENEENNKRTARTLVFVRILRKFPRKRMGIGISLVAFREDAAEHSKCCTSEKYDSWTPFFSLKRTFAKRRVLSLMKTICSTININKAECVLTIAAVTIEPYTLLNALKNDKGFE